MYNKFPSFVFSLVGLAVMFTVMVEAAPKCTKKDHNKVDQCATELTFLGDDNFLRNPPKNLKEINAICKKLKPRETCLRNYADKCLTSEQKQTLLVAIYAITRTNKRYCSSNKRKNALIDVLKCVKPELTFFSQLMKNTTREFHGIRSYKPSNLRIPMSCCIYYKYKDIGLEAFRKACPNNDEAVLVIEDGLQGYVSDVLNLSCGEYTEESDKCQHLLDKVPKWNKPLEWKNFMMPLLEMLDGDPLATKP